MNRRGLLPLLLAALVACDGDDEDRGNEWSLTEYDGEEVPVVLATVEADIIPRLPPCEAELADEVLLQVLLALGDDGVLDMVGTTQLVYHCASGEDEAVTPDHFEGDGTWSESGGAVTLSIPDEVAAYLPLDQSWTGAYSEDGDELIVEASDFEEVVVLRFARSPFPSP